MHDRGGGREAGLDAALTGGQANADGNVRLSRAAWAESNYVLTAGDELAAGQVEDELLVQAGVREAFLRMQAALYAK